MNLSDLLMLYNDIDPIVALVAIAYALFITVAYLRSRRDVNSASERIALAEKERNKAQHMQYQAKVDLGKLATQYAELQKRMADLVAMKETIRHDIYKHLQKVAHLLKKSGQQQVANDLYSTADKIKFHLQADFEYKEQAELEIEGGTSLPANGETIASRVRFFSRILEIESVIDIEGDQYLGMAGKLFTWDLLFHYILTNAVEHLQPGGRILVKIDSDGQSFGRVDISNDGKPISKKKRKRIFELGYTDKPYDTKQPSFGTGLYLAREIAAGMGGAEILEPTNVYRYFVFRRGVRFSIVNLPVIPATERMLTPFS